MNNRWLNIHQAAEYLGMTSKFALTIIQRWCKEGKLEYGRRGNRYAFTVEMLDEFVLKNGSAGARQIHKRKSNQLHVA